VTFAILIGALLLAGGAALAALTVAVGQIDRLTEQDAPLDTANAELLHAADTADTALRNYLETNQPELRRAYHQAVIDFGDQLERARGFSDGFPGIDRPLDRQEALFDRWVETVAEPAIEEWPTDPTAAQARLNGEQASTLNEQLRAANTDADTLISVERTEARLRVSRLARTMLFIVAAVILLGLAASWYRARHLQRQLTQPLHRLRSTVSRLESGDLDARSSVEGVEEVRTVSEAVNALADENQRLTLRQAQRLEQERLVRRLAGSLHEHLDVSRILSLAAAAVGESLAVDRVVFQLSAEDGFGPVVLEWRAPGVAPLGEAAQLALPRDHPVLRPVLDEGFVAQSVHTGTRFDDSVRDLLAELDIQAAFSVPVYSGDVVVALMTLHVLGQPRQWQPSEIDLVQAVADELGAALRHAQLYEAERDMVKRLRELDQVKSDFVSSVSHELRSPLTSILGYVEMLRDRDAGPVTGEQDHMLGVVERNTDRLLALIEDLLTLSRIESGAFKVTLLPVDVSSLLDSVIQTIRPELVDRELQLDVEVDPDIPAVLGDAHQLERVLLNLLSNAMKFTPSGGRIRVAACLHDHAVRLQVTDTGIGIPPEEQSRLFTRFFRSSTSQQYAIKGTGLGLAIVKSVVESHGGNVGVTSEPGRGTTVTVELPAAETPAELPVPAREVAG
jgi:signal transduction histidine kinase/CHASE3 domain sensor protein